MSNPGVPAKPLESAVASAPTTKDPNVAHLRASREAAQSAGASDEHAARHWAEVCAAFGRIVQRKPILCASVAADAVAYWIEVLSGLLAFANNRYLAAMAAASTGQSPEQRFRWLDLVAQYHEAGLYVLVQYCCCTKHASAMVGDAAGAQLAAAAVAQVAKHLNMFTKVYTEFTDLCVSRTRNAKKIDSSLPQHVDRSVVAAVLAIVKLLEMCTHHDFVCNELTKQSEPAALCMRLLYGMKLRSQHSNLFCPPVKDAEDLQVEPPAAEDPLSNSLNRSASCPALLQQDNSSLTMTGGSFSTSLTEPSTPVVTLQPDQLKAMSSSPLRSLRPGDLVHAHTPIDAIHDVALRCVVEVLKHQRGSLKSCPTSSAVVVNVCSYVSVNVNLAEPESTVDECLAILFNTRCLLRTIQQFLMETPYLDDRHYVIDEVLKEHNGESLLDQVRALIVRTQSYVTADLGVLECVRNLLLVGPLSLPQLSGVAAAAATATQQQDSFGLGASYASGSGVGLKTTPKAVRSKATPTVPTGPNKDTSPPQMSSSLAMQTPHTASSKPRALGRSVASGALHKMMHLFGDKHSSSSHHTQHSASSVATFLTSGVPLDPTDVASVVASSLQHSLSDDTDSMVSNPSLFASEVALHRATLSVLCSFVPLEHMEVRIRAAACECIRWFVFGASATISIVALPETVRRDPIGFFLSAASMSMLDVTSGGNPMLDMVTSLSSAVDRSDLYACVLHALHSILRQHHAAPTPQQIDQLATFATLPDVLSSPRLLPQALLVWTSAINFTLHSGSPLTGTRQDADFGFVASQEALVELLDKACHRQLSGDPMSGSQTSLDGAVHPYPTGAPTPAPVEGAPRRAEGFARTDSSYIDIALLAEETDDAVRSRFTLLELLARLCGVVLSCTQKHTSETLVRTVLGLLQRMHNHDAAAPTSVPKQDASSGASPPALSVVIASSPTVADQLVYDQFADKCLTSLLLTDIPTAMTSYVDTLSNPQLASKFLPYLLELLETSTGGGGSSTKPSNVAVLQRFRDADGLRVVADIMAEILNEGDDVTLLFPLLQLVGVFMSPLNRSEVRPTPADGGAEVMAPSSYGHVEALLHLVASAQQEAAQIALGQALLDSAVCAQFNRNSGKRLETSSNPPRLVGPFYLRQPHCVAEKPYYLDVIPQLLAAMHAAGHAASAELLSDAMFVVLETTGQVNSTALLQWAVSNNLTKWLRYLHLPLPMLRSFPYTASAPEMHRFWAPLLSQAPRRSDLRFHTSGGISITVDSWPEAGLSVSAWFRFHELYPQLPLFEVVGMGEGNAPVSDELVIESGETIYANHNAAASLGPRKRSVLNEHAALEGLDPQRWLHFTLVMSPARTMTFYFHGRVVGSVDVPACVAPKSKAEIHIGFVTKKRDAAFFSIGDVQLWCDELTAPQVLADYCGSDPHKFAPKILATDVPREWLLATSVAGSVVTASMPIASRIARFTPHGAMHHQRAKESVPHGTLHQLVNLCASNERLVTAVVQHARILPPVSFVQFHKLFLSRGGLRYLVEWIDAATTEAELDEALQLFAESVRGVNMTETMRPRMYALAAYLLRGQARTLLTKHAACKTLLRIAAVPVPVNKQQHPVLINRMALDYLLTDVDMIQMMRQDVACAFIGELTKLFDVNTNKAAKRNFEYVLGLRVFDKLLHGLIRVAAGIARTTQLAWLELLRKMILASDCHKEVISGVLHVVAVLTPQAMLLEGRHHTAVIPVESRVATINIPMRLMHFLSMRLLQLLIDLLSSPGMAVHVAALVHVPWFLAVVNSRFACTHTVMLAARLLADAMQQHPPLLADCQLHTFALCASLQQHSFDTNVVVFLLAAAVGLHQKLNLSDTNTRSVLRQLDDIVASAKTEAHVVFGPVYASILHHHMHNVSNTVLAEAVASRSIHCNWPFSTHMSWRTRRYFSAVKVIGMLLFHVKAKRYQVRRRFNHSSLLGNYNTPFCNDAQSVAMAPVLNHDAGEPQQPDEEPLADTAVAGHAVGDAVIATMAASHETNGSASDATVPSALACTPIAPRSPTARDGADAESCASSTTHLHLDQTAVPNVAPASHTASGCATPLPSPSVTGKCASSSSSPPVLGDMAFPPFRERSTSERSMREHVVVTNDDGSAMRAVDLFETGTMRPLGQLPPRFRRAMQLLLPIVRLILAVQHARYDKFNNRLKLKRRDRMSVVGAVAGWTPNLGNAAAGGGGNASHPATPPTPATTGVVSEATRFIVTSTRFLASHTHVFPAFGGGPMQCELLAYLASQVHTPTDALFPATLPMLLNPGGTAGGGDGGGGMGDRAGTPSAAGGPSPTGSTAYDAATSNVSSFATAMSFRKRPQHAATTVTPSHGMTPPLIVVVKDDTTAVPTQHSMDASHLDEDTFASTWTGFPLPSTSMEGPPSESGSIAGDDALHHDEESSGSDSDEAEAGSIHSVAHWGIHHLFDEAEKELNELRPATATTEKAAPMEGLSELTRSMLEAIVVTSLKVHDTAFVLQQGAYGNREFPWMVRRYGPCGTLLAHCLTSFMRTAASTKEDSLRITLIFCAAFTHVFDELQAHYQLQHKAVAPVVAAGNPNEHVPTTTGGSEDAAGAAYIGAPPRDATGGTSAKALAVPLVAHAAPPQPVRSVAAPAQQPAAGASSAVGGVSYSIAKHEETVVRNTLAFVAFLCDRVVTNILPLDAILPFLLETLRVLSKSQVQVSVDVEKHGPKNMLAGCLMRRQLVRIAIVVLTRPDPSPLILEHALALLTATLQREWDIGSQLEELVRVLHINFKTPPVRNYEQVHLLLTSLWRCVISVYAKTPRLKKCLTGGTLTATVTLNQDFHTACTPSPEDARVLLDKLYHDRRDDLEVVMADRPKKKYDDALRQEHRMVKQYKLRIPCIATARDEFRNRSNGAALMEGYWGLFGSQVDNLSPIDSSNAHWLFFNNAIHPEPTPFSATIAAAVAAASCDGLDLSCTTTTTHNGSSDLLEAAEGSVVLGATTGRARCRRHYYDTARNYVPFQLQVDDDDDGCCGSPMQGALDKAARSASVVDASISEEMTSVVSVFVPNFICRCPPIPTRDEATRIFHPECSTNFSDSARFLLRFLLSPGERVRHICNAFRVDGIHSTPCVVILTESMLKVYASARITSNGDLVMGADESQEGEDGETSSVGAGSTASQPRARSSSAIRSTASDGGSPIRKHRGGGGVSFRNLERFAHRTKLVTQRLQDRVRHTLFGADDNKHLRGTKLAKTLHHASSSIHGGNSVMRGLCWFYFLNNVTKLQKIQYLHQDCAVLISLAHDNGPLLAIMDDNQSLTSDARDMFFNVARKILGTQTTYIDEAQKKVLLETATERWVHRSCSTYEYLLTLNSIANRVRKDWNQYPVFPWVLQDYSSTGPLDLTQAAIYRDLMLPIGAQLEERRVQLASRYQTLREEQQQEEEDHKRNHESQSIIEAILTRVEGGSKSHVMTFPFHFGSHYSSSAAVLFYLIRTEPFTTRAKIYQGGSFDHADRLFSSIQDAYRSCTQAPADCKELIPEFYARGQFLENTDERVLGTRQDDSPVHDVLLPPWAQGSQHVFVAVMRMALESEHVSQRIHRWIDLIFGIRQRGKLSAESFNVYQRFTYGEEVRKALLATKSLQECHAIVAEVENFGQTPVQLFDEAHPRRKNHAPTQQQQQQATDVPPVQPVQPTAGAQQPTEGAPEAPSMPPAQAPSAPAVDDANPAASTGPGQSASATRIQYLSRPTKLQAMFAHALQCTLDDDASRNAPRHTEEEAQSNVGAPNYPRFQLQEVPPAVGVASVHPSLLRRFHTTPSAVQRTTSSSTTPPTASAAAAPPATAAAGAPVTSLDLHADGRWYPDAERVKLIPETDTCICWHPFEGRLLRYRTTTGEFLSAVQFEIPEGLEDMAITSLVVCRREVFLCLGTSSGVIYCLHPDSVRTWCVLGTTLCVHTSPVRNMVASERLSRMVSLPSDPDDFPIVWRIQRLLVAKLHRLPMDLVTPDTDRVATGVSLCPRDGLTFLSTRRRIVVFDSDGTPWGVGALPSPADAGSTTFKVFADVSAVQHFITSDWGDGRVAVFTGHVDGSIGVWIVQRNPPSTVAPLSLVTVKFIRQVAAPNPQQGTQLLGAVTTFRQPLDGTPSLLVGHQSGQVREFSFVDTPPVTAKAH